MEKRMNSPLILVGGGGHCIATLDVLESAGISIAGIIHGLDQPLEYICGYPPLGYDDKIPALRGKYNLALITVGQIKTPIIRKRLYTLLKKNNYDLATVISPCSTISQRTKVGEGTIIMHNVCINRNVTVGDNSIINTGAIVEHGCQIGNHCHISIGSILCGNVSIGDGAFIGAGSVCREGIHIGENAVIGCGLRILFDIPPHKTIKSNVLSPLT